MKNDRHIPEAPLAPIRLAWLMLVVIAAMAACYPAIKLGLDSAPPLRFGALRTNLETSRKDLKRNRNDC